MNNSFGLQSVRIGYIDAAGTFVETGSLTQDRKLTMRPAPTEPVQVFDFRASLPMGVTHTFTKKFRSKKEWKRWHKHWNGGLTNKQWHRQQRKMDRLRKRGFVECECTLTDSDGNEHEFNAMVKIEPKSPREYTWADVSSQKHHRQGQDQFHRTTHRVTLRIKKKNRDTGG